MAGFSGHFFFITKLCKFRLPLSNKMKPKLKIFEEFSSNILPHEARYLSTIANFQDSEKQEIFNKLIHNAQFPEQPEKYNSDIDKRKYHYIKTWVEQKLQQRNVDDVGAWILDFLKKISLDLVTAEEEKQMLDYIKSYRKIGYNFQVLYQVMREYRSYLLVRIRYDDHLIVLDFLERFSSQFEKAVKIQQKLYVATDEITKQYTEKKTTSVYWERWLKKVFEGEEINGNNRYKAFVLLAFLYNTTKNAEKQRDLFSKIDVYFSKGDLYSRRILYNFYSNSVLLHSQLQDFEKAIYYGKLAVRQNNEDTLMYVNNLAASYLRTEKFREANQLMEAHRSVFENSHNDYQRITFISYELRILAELGQLQKAENIGIYFLKKFESEIFEYRWHHFFTSYFQVLVERESYATILQLDKKFNLENLAKKSSFIPNLSWAISLSNYMENRISKEELISKISDSLQDLNISKSNLYLVRKNVKMLSKNLPEIKGVFKSHI